MPTPKWFAGAVSGKVWMSDDGVSWTYAATLVNSAQVQNVANGYCFAGTKAGGVPNNYAYTTDGTNWTYANAGLGRVVWTGTNYINAATNVAQTSTTPNGPWTGVYTGVDTTAAIYRAGLTVLVGGSKAAWSDDNGVSWTVTTPTGRFLRDVTYGAGRYIAAAAYPPSAAGLPILTSTDGKTWTEVSVSGLFSGIMVAWDGSKFVAVGTASTGSVRTATSADGLTWTVHTPTGLMSSGLFSVARMASDGAGRCCLVNPLGDKIWTSTDGINWTSATFAGEDIRHVTYGLVGAPAGGRRGLGLIR